MGGSGNSSSPISRVSRTVATLAVMVTALVGAVTTTASVARAGEDVIYTVQGDELMRLGTEEYSMTVVGSLDTDDSVVDLTFDSRGRLLGLFEDESIRIIDTETAVTTLLVPGPADLPFVTTLFTSLTEGSDGWLYLFDSGSLRLKKIDPETGGARWLEVHPNPDTWWGSVLYFVKRYRDQLVGFGFSKQDSEYIRPLLSVGEVTASASVLDGPDDWSGWSLDYGSDGDFWVLMGPGLIFPPIYFLHSVDPETGYRVGDKPSYDFIGGLFQFAVQRGGAEGAQTCVPDATTLCLLEDRFRVQVTWQDGQGGAGSGYSVPGSSDNAGLFWFFSDDNWELSLKLLDGCALTGHHWFFLSGTTDVGFTVTLTDTLTNEEKVYKNPTGQSAESVIDLESMGGCS